MILVTGASGFVGGELVRTLKCKKRYPLRLAVREASEHLLALGEVIPIGAISAETDWAHALTGVSVVVHCAARVHAMNDTSANPLAAFRAVNVGGTLNLARQAATAGVSRLIMLSSVKVNGESTLSGKPFRPEDLPAPEDAYGISKREAEDGLIQIALEADMEVVILRLPLVYGPGVKANFLSMMRWINRGAPLPFGAIQNKRSFVALDNLLDLIMTCIDHPAAANQTFFVSDGEDISTTELLRRVGQALGRPTRLFPAPVSLLQSVAALSGKRALAQRLFGSLQVDISKTRTLLGWNPPISVDEGLRRTAKKFLNGL